MKLKFALIFILLIMSHKNGLCQKPISGFVKDMTGMPIKNVNIQIVDTYDGTTTDSLGCFLFKSNESGNIILRFSHINFNSVEIEMNRDSCEQKPLNIRMKEKSLPLDEVIVTSSIGYSKNKSVAINKMDVYTNPHANGDLALALRTTSGLQQIDNKEGFFVRGGNSDETVVSINGVIIHNFFTPGISNIAGRSRFETGLFKGMNFSTGDIPVEYGNAMSGSLELKIDDMPENNLFGLGLSPVYATANAGKLFSQKTAYIEGAISYSNPELYYPVFMKKGWKFSHDNNGYTGTIRFQKKFQNSATLTFLSSAANNNMGMSNEYENALVDTKIRDFISMNILDFHALIGEKTRLNIASGYSKGKKYSSINIRDYAAISKDTTNNDFFQAHAKAVTDFGVLRLMSGIDYFNDRQSFNTENFDDQTFAAYMSSVFRVGNMPLFLNLGLREEYSAYYKDWMFMPRGVLSYTINKANSITLGIGMYNQTENTFMNYGVIPHGKSKSIQYNLTYQLNTSNERLLRIQAFMKKYNELTKLKGDLKGNAVQSNGRGYANGIDLFWKDTESVSNLEYTVSYSFLDSRRDYLYGNHYALPVFAAKHNASCVVKYYLPKISSQFAVSFAYRSKMPYLIEETNTVKYIPDVFSSDISYNYLFNVKKIRGVLSLSVPSIFNNNSTLGYRLNSQGGLENITYPIKQTFFVSLFINLGVDRRSEIINSLINY